DFTPQPPADPAHAPAPADQPMLAYFPEVGDSWLLVVQLAMLTTIAFATIQLAWALIYVLAIPLTGASPAPRMNAFHFSSSSLPVYAIWACAVAWGSSAVCCLARVRSAWRFYIISGIAYLAVEWVYSIYHLFLNVKDFGLYSSMTLSSPISL